MTGSGTVGIFANCVLSCFETVKILLHEHGSSPKVVQRESLLTRESHALYVSRFVVDVLYLFQIDLDAAPRAPIAAARRNPTIQRVRKSFGKGRECARVWMNFFRLLLRIGLNGYRSLQILFESWTK